MNSLIENKLTSDRKLSFRLQPSITSSNFVIIGIPGGPGISGSYLDDLIFQLGHKTKSTACVFDLPNHATIPELNNNKCLRFRDVVDSLETGVREVSEAKHILLVGHSFGARLALELMGRLHETEASAALISLAANYDSSERYKAHSAPIRATHKTLASEMDFQKYWYAVLPLYFCRAPAVENLEILTKNTSWMDNACQTDETPPMPMNFTEKQQLERLMVIEGEQDLRLPDNNSQLIQTALPHVKILKIHECGHFPMLESGDELKIHLTNFIVRCVNPW